MNEAVREVMEKAVLSGLRAFGHYYPYEKGKWPIIKKTLKMLNPQERMCVVTTPDCRLFCAKVLEQMYIRLYFSGEYEASETALFQRLIRDGDTAFDIGANFGYFTTLFSKMVGSRGRVHSFEPTPPSFAELMYHIYLNQCAGNVIANPLGLSDEVGETEVFVFSNLKSGHASMSSLGRSDGVAHPCEVVTLDEYVKKNSVTQIDIIKCDVEGFELNVFRGGAESIRRFHPTILVEINHETANAAGYSPAEMLRYICELANYKVLVDVDGIWNERRNFEGIEDCNALAVCRDDHAGLVDVVR